MVALRTLTIIISCRWDVTIAVQELVMETTNPKIKKLDPDCTLLFGCILVAVSDLLSLVLVNQGAQAIPTDRIRRSL